MGLRGELPKSIYKFAYAQGDKVIAPKKHWRHAIDLSKNAGKNLIRDFAYQTRLMDSTDDQTS